LNGAEDSWGVVVETVKTSCTVYHEHAIHEVGHLFGAGHLPPPYSLPNFYLFPDSHAFKATVPFAGVWRTIMAGPVGGIQTNTFSAAAGSTNNRQALVTTAQSVANYRRGVVVGPPVAVAQCSDGIDNDGNALTDYPAEPGCSSPTDETESSIPPPPGCGLTPPTFVTGALTGVCAPPPWTSHSVSWVDLCPEASSSYEIWYSQPDGSPYSYGWTLVNPLTNVFVTGSNSRIRVRSCNGPSCAPLSASSYVALSQC
jgi:hypothetical protein